MNDGHGFSNEFMDMILDQADRRYTNKLQKQPYVLGAAAAIGFYSKEIKAYDALKSEIEKLREYISMELERVKDENKLLSREVVFQLEEVGRLKSELDEQLGFTLKRINQVCDLEAELERAKGERTVRFAPTSSNSTLILTEQSELKEEIERLQAENEKLRDNLLKYGSHDSDCAATRAPDEDYDIACTCGFGAALKDGV